MSASGPLRTSAWYGDRELALPFPDGWEVSILWPRTPPPLSDGDIAAALRRPIDQPPIAQIAQAKSRPLVIVDDLTRPTPTDRILPFVLSELEAGGVEPSAVTVVVGAGTHGIPSRDALAKKAGSRAAAVCRLIGHDDKRNLVKVGRTSFGGTATRRPRNAPAVIRSDAIYRAAVLGFPMK